LITGGGSPPKKDARIYLTVKNEITNKCPMNESRNAHAITMCKGNIFVLGGFSGKQRLNSVEKYIVKEDKWTQMAVMKDKRHYLSACTINDEFIYAFGGFFGSTEQEINDTIEVYEVEKNTWVVLTVRMKVRLPWTDFVRIHSGLAVRLLCRQLRSFLLEARTLTETEKFTSST
jgi:N-acetylneuraminic acid mutarotase